MSLTLHVDTARWQAHLDRTVADFPGIVPVVKGNGYGFGADELFPVCRRITDTAAPAMIAVGTYREAPAAVAALAGSGAAVLVLEPFRRGLHDQLDGLDAPSLVHTVTDLADLAAFTRLAPGARFVAEGLTTMNRHGAPADRFGELLGADPARLLGGTLHMPLGAGHVTEVAGWVDRFPSLDTWFVSHLSATELAGLRAAYPAVAFRPRIGTALWLGAPDALSVRADVLDVRPVAAGDRAGYRGRRLPAGHLVVVSGGTAHGVAMAAPTSAATLRQRVIALAEGASEAIGRVRSPFVHAGAHLWFVEPPHMQVSLVHVPRGVDAPGVGESLSARVRLTTTTVDEVVWDA